MSTSEPHPVFTPPAVGTSIGVNGKYYVIGEAIGNGHFGQVFSCTDDWGNQLVAKVLLPQDRTYAQVEQSWMRELNNLLALRHPNVTFVHDAFECDETFYLVLERCHSDLHDLINLPNRAPDFWIPPIARCVLRGIHFIHSNGYVHKDLHPGNVFTSFVADELNRENQSALVFKVGDLEISRLLPEVDVFNTILASMDAAA